MNTPITINQYGRGYMGEINRRRTACRAIITDGDKILLSHETNTDMFLIPGGGLEKGEALEECCKREIAEETGYAVETGEQFLNINEYYEDCLYESFYFICKIIGKGKQQLTDSEILHGVTPEWVNMDAAIEIFGKYNDYTDINEEKRGQYLREYQALLKYKERG